MEVVIGVALAVVGATAATAIARVVAPRGRGPRVALAVAPTGLLIGAGAAMARGWDLLPSALLGMVLVGLVGLAGGLRVQRPSRRRS